MQHFEIIGLDKLLDSSLESMHEENTAGDSVDVDEQEEMHHENANVCFSIYPVLSLSCVESVLIFTFLKFTKR